MLCVVVDTCLVLLVLVCHFFNQEISWEFKQRQGSDVVVVGAAKSLQTAIFLGSLVMSKIMMMWTLASGRSKTLC
jgi:hypothetical protein